MHSLARIFYIYFLYIFLCALEFSFIYTKNKKDVIINSLSLLKSLCGMFVLSAEL